MFSNRSLAYLRSSEDQSAAGAALLDAERVIAMDPNWGRGYFRKASAFLAMDNSGAALDSIEQGLAKIPTDKQLRDQKELILSKKPKGPGLGFSRCDPLNTMEPKTAEQPPVNTTKKVHTTPVRMYTEIGVFVVIVAIVFMLLSLI